MFENFIRFKLFIICSFLIWNLFSSGNSFSYSILTHQAVVDAAWDKSIRPLLLLKYPGTTTQELKEALSYSYGGSIMPDMGYYPMGSKFFTALLHYVRTGDFVEALINESTNVNELAFACGALAHYNADKFGHSMAVNPSVAMMYPQVGSRYGKCVTYEQDHISHVRMEFGFDVLQVAANGYTPEQFYDFIGFRISSPSLERAFYKTYGIELRKLFVNFPIAVSLLRFSVRSFLPELTKGAFLCKKKEIQEKYPGTSLKKFRYKMPNSAYNKNWGKEFKQPGIVARFMKVTIAILPKYGPFKVLRFKAPSKDAEMLFIKSFGAAVQSYSYQLNKLQTQTLQLTNIDFDTGELSKVGEYKLADDTFLKLIDNFKNKNPDSIDPALGKSMVTFFHEYKCDLCSRKERKKWIQTSIFLKKYRSLNNN